MHNGGCLVKDGSNGWDGGPNTKASSAMECLKNCSARGINRAYFGFASKEPGTDNSCACFLEDKICEPGKNPKLDVYLIDWTDKYFTDGEPYRFLHNGGCLVKDGSNGWDGGPNKKALTAMDCLEICRTRAPYRQYFGFRSKQPGTDLTDCSCFLGDSVCEPGNNPEVDIYSIQWKIKYFSEGKYI